jgi:hypothetical protein
MFDTKTYWHIDSIKPIKQHVLADFSRVSNIHAEIAKDFIITVQQKCLVQLYDTIILSSKFQTSCYPMRNDGNSNKARGLGCEVNIEQIKIYLVVRRVKEYWQSGQQVVELA